MAIKSCANCTRHTGTVMRVLIAVNFFAGLCLIIFGATVQKPIVDFPAVAMVLMGVLSLISAIIGLMSGQKWKCCLTVFLALHGLNTVFQIALVASLWFNFDGVKSALDPKHTGAYDAAHMTRVLQAARVVMLLFVLCEITTFVLAILMRFVLKEDPTAAYNNFDEDNLQERALTMAALRTDIETGRTTYNSTNNSIYNKIRGKMAKKYGEHTHGFKWKSSWWPF